MDGKDVIIFNEIKGFDEICKLYSKLNKKVGLMAIALAACVIYTEINSKKQEEKIETLNKKIEELKGPKGE